MSALKGGDCISKKLTHTLIQSYSVSHVRGSIIRHINIQQSVSEKNRKYQTNFLCGKFHQSTQAQGGNIVISFLFLTFRFLLRHFGKMEKRKIKGKSLCAPPLDFRSVHHLFKDLFYSFLLFSSEILLTTVH